MKTQANRILAVIDPTQVDQWALRKALSIGGDQEGSRIFAYLCIHSNAKCDDRELLRSVELRRHRLWLDDILSDFAQQKAAIEPIVEWHPDWRQAICTAAHAADADLVIKRASGRPNSLANSDRQLIRTLKDSALLLVKHDPSAELRKVLVAVDFNARDEAHMALNAAVTEMGRRIRGSRSGIELHSIFAYPESDRFVHPPDIARALEIDRSQAHVRWGDAADVIPDAANSIAADLVIIGNMGRRGLLGITDANTAEKILTDIASDVLVLVREVQRARAAA
jgi:nucleotide-binding universal stress UspA family protein